MDRLEKQQLVASLRQMFEDSHLVVITQQTGLTVDEVTKLRAKMREAGCSFKVTKNRLTKIALDGTKYEALKPQFTGPTAVAVSQDPVAAAKVSVEFAEKNDKMTIVGGALGDQQLDVAGIKALAKLPSLDELRGKIVGLLQAPAGKIVGVLQAPGGQVARVLNAKAQQGDAA